MRFLHDLGYEEYTNVVHLDRFLTLEDKPNQLFFKKFYRDRKKFKCFVAVYDSALVVSVHYRKETRANYIIDLDHLNDDDLITDKDTHIRNVVEQIEARARDGLLTFNGGRGCT